MLTCPRCSFRPLSVTKVGNVEVDHCRRCGGSFLESGEIEQVFGGAVSPESLAASGDGQVIGPSRMPCPHHGVGMTALRVDLAGQTVVIDICPQGNGVWLDAREGSALHALRAQQRELREANPKKPGIRAYLFQLLTTMPLEVWNPTRRKPVATWTLIGVLIAVFVGQVIGMASGDGFGDPITNNLALVPEGMMARPWTLLTYAFLHGSVLHLLGNLYFLWLFGDNIEDEVGRSRYLFIAAVTGIIGGLAHALMAGMPDVPLVGASGAIAGLMGAYLVLFPRVKVWMVILFIRFRMSVWIYLAVWIGLQVLNLFLAESLVAWWAHIGGFASGMVFGLMIRKSTLRRLEAAAGAGL